MNQVIDSNPGEDSGTYSVVYIGGLSGRTKFLIMKTDNELIAEFMGGEVITKIYQTDRQVIKTAERGNWYLDDLRYDTSWDWLMPVVQKIDSLYKISKTTLHEDIHYWSVLNLDITATIKEVHWSVIEFIKWYNFKPLK